MPFMVGKAPIRRTLEYLKNCNIIFRENVKIFSISYLVKKEHSLGAKEFVFWNLPQVQFNNPEVQCVKLKNLTPTPFIKIYRDDDEPVLIDLDSRTREEIVQHLENLYFITKTKEEIEIDKEKHGNKLDPSFFGVGCKRHCICEVPGQIPCPSIVMLPTHWRGIPDKTPKLIIPPVIEKWGKQIMDEHGSLENYEKKIAEKQ